MRFIKEFVHFENINPRYSHFRVIIRLPGYNSNLTLFDAMYEEAKKDFPSLKREDCEIVHYAGQRYARTFGLEFNSKTQPPKVYEPLANTELTY